MKRTEFTLFSEVDGLPLQALLIAPGGPVRGVVQISHGMSEHKERYEDFMFFLAQHGYAAVIHDHRGHGGSVRSPNDLGYFYTEDTDATVSDLHQVSQWILSHFPRIPLFLFAHSMGTLVARNYLKKHDTLPQKVVLCGPPTQNPGVSLAIALAKTSSLQKGPSYRNRGIHQLALGLYDRRFEGPSAWLSSDPLQVERFLLDPLCGFSFTNNGFLHLFSLLQGAYSKSGWSVEHPNLPILLMAGKDDPVIQSESKFRHLATFLCSLGYTNVSARLYPYLRHELLNEKDHLTIYRDLLVFWDT